MYVSLVFCWQWTHAVHNTHFNQCNNIPEYTLFYGNYRSISQVCGWHHLNGHPSCSTPSPMSWRDPQHQCSWDAHLTHMYITLVVGVCVSSTSWCWCHAACHWVIDIINVIIWWDVSHTGPWENTASGEDMSTEETDGEKRGKVWEYWHTGPGDIQTDHSTESPLKINQITSAACMFSFIIALNSSD